MRTMQQGLRDEKEARMDLSKDVKQMRDDIG